MLTIHVKFTTGLFRTFDDVDVKYTSIGGDFLTVGINQKIDEKGKWLSGTAIRMPIVNILYFETTDTSDGATVEGEGKVVE